MKFIHYLEQITGVGIYPLISLTVFFVFFTAMTLWSIKADKKYIEALKNIPFPEKNN
ncbi:MAG: CcoQ/FixQ family Cbb3-type cytochrome c oxidase assembly chaperone [Flavipsychrobacter sp.]|nr:CcoQ/FixQ family Cbb3-type cytochrome c oxidase assembly chaperone [Flavipsychrobacter sp.]